MSLSRAFAVIPVLLVGFSVSQATEQFGPFGRSLPLVAALTLGVALLIGGLRALRIALLAAFCASFGCIIASAFAPGINPRLAHQVPLMIVGSVAGAIIGIRWRRRVNASIERSDARPVPANSARPQSPASMPDRLAP